MYIIYMYIYIHAYVHAYTYASIYRMLLLFAQALANIFKIEKGEIPRKHLTGIVIVGRG